MAVRSFLSALAATTLASAQITIDVTETHQVIRGLGYAEAFQRSQWVYNTMSEEKQQEMFDLLHDPVTGAGFSILRLGVGSSANNSKDWMVSIQPESPGTPDAEPTYVWDRNDSSQVWWAKEVQKRGVNLFYANSWGADAYMKDTGSTDNGGYLCGVTNTSCETGDWREQYANKLVQWVKYYAEEGINITHLNPLNEPDIAVPYASMQADGQQTTDILEKLRPAVDEAGLDVKITCCDWAGWEDGRKILKGIQDTGGEKYLDVVSGHGYGQPLSDPYDTPLEVWQGEWAELSSYFDQPWYSAEGDPKGTYGGGEGITWANRILHSFTVSNISAFLNWMGAQPSNAATPVIRTINDTNILSKRYWAYAAFGRYARQSSSRVTATSTTDNVTVAAWTPQEAAFPAGGNLAMQIINNADEEKIVPITIDKLTDITNSTALLLNNEFDLAESDSVVEINGTAITATIPPRSLVVLALDAVWP
ncbi:hypothetical protein KVR01_003256 [Diaporthe batatas]|uniref:uncharacterized protein n=1 Tax=Diaporthe batatas TaxID=748121 RepID=UPI001D059708|nr:uncharacterized protein KVR01_003256 [Diaporthe batatas]KAG8167567.1 hypothetical protein KVR01_003256 [Diaporthe batatas]